MAREVPQIYSTQSVRAFVKKGGEGKQDAVKQRTGSWVELASACNLGHEVLDLVACLQSSFQTEEEERHKKQLKQRRTEGARAKNNQNGYLCTTN